MADEVDQATVGHVLRPTKGVPARHYVEKRPYNLRKRKSRVTQNEDKTNGIETSNSRKRKRDTSAGTLRVPNFERKMGYNLRGRKVLPVTSTRFDLKIIPYRELYVDKEGGDISIDKANVHLHIPPGALAEGVLVSLAVLFDEEIYKSLNANTVNLCPIVKCAPDGLKFAKNVLLKIPHCGLISGKADEGDIFCGKHIKGKQITWKKDGSIVCKMDSEFFLVYLDHFTFVYPVTRKENIKKRLRVVPLVSRMTSSLKNATITIWLCNDNITVYNELLYNEINQQGKTLLDSYENFIMQNSGEDIVSTITHVADDWVPYPDDQSKFKVFKSLSGTLERADSSPIARMQEQFVTTTVIKHEAIWEGNRRKITFQLKHRASGSQPTLLRMSINVKQNGQNADMVTFVLEKQISEILGTPSNNHSSSFDVRGSPETTGNPFGKLQLRIARLLDRPACIKIATYFTFSRSLIYKIKKSDTPAMDLLDVLLQRGLFSAKNIGHLLEVLQELEMEDAANLLLGFRQIDRTPSSTEVTIPIQTNNAGLNSTNSSFCSVC